MEQLNFFGLLVVIVAGITCINGKRLGEGCIYDKECGPEGSFKYCSPQQVCSCYEGFSRDYYGNDDTCIANVGMPCQSASDCQSLRFSTCKDGRCLCREGYTPSDKVSRKTLCLQFAQNENSDCEEEIQCRSLGNDASCQGGRCRCMQDSHYDTRARFCFRNAGLGAPCQNDSYCYIGERNNYMTTCRNGNCRCNDGFVRDGDSCTGAASRLKIFSSSFALVIVLLFIFC